MAISGIGATGYPTAGYEIRRTGIRKGSEKWNYVVRQELELSKTVKVPKDYDLVKEV